MQKKKCLLHLIDHMRWLIQSPFQMSKEPLVPESESIIFYVVIFVILQTLTKLLYQNITDHTIIYICLIATMANKQKRCHIPIIVLRGGQGVVIKKKMLVCLQEGWVSLFVNMLTLVMILGLQTQKNTNKCYRIIWW